MKPILKIGNEDFSAYTESIEPKKGDLDADGSGRDVQTGLMYRNKITDKLTLSVKMLKIPEDIQLSLTKALNSEYYYATILDPRTNTQKTLRFYTSSVPFGVQRYDKSAKKTFYEGMTFDMIER